MTIVCALLLCVSSMVAAEESDAQVLFREDFEAGIGAWQTEGQAEFSAAAEKPHGGQKAAKIVLTAGVKPAYQKFVRVIDEKVSGGDAYHVSVWVRTEGVNSDPGAYVALEYFDGDKRLDVSHGGHASDNSAREWQQLKVEGTAPKGSRRVRLALLLHANGSAWFDDVEVMCTRYKPIPEKPPAPCAIRISSENVIHPNFGGVGFHCSEHEHTFSQEHFDQVLAKRWRELRPSFARLGDNCDWKGERRDIQANYIRMMKDVGTEVYVTTWNPKDVPEGPERKAYAKSVVDYLEYLVRTKGCTNIKYYCMTNELSMKQWGAMNKDLPKFKSYHQCFYDELNARKLDIKLLATDASPVGCWPSIEWASKNMDEITGVYGGHHYINDYQLEDVRFYGWFLQQAKWGAGLARAKGKNFILGEFGSKQDNSVVNGVKQDRCIWYETPQEPLAALQVCEAGIAAINGGVYALGYWTFADYPDEYSRGYINKWGAFRWSKTDHSTRAVYYSYGLLTRFFRGPATTLSVSSSDPLLRVAAVQHHGAKTISVAVINRYNAPAEVKVGVVPASLPAGTEAGTTLKLRKYVYETAHVPQHPFGDMQAPAGQIEMKDGAFSDNVAPLSLSVYTSEYDDDPPAAVKDVKAEKNAEGKWRVSWSANTEADFCYYRVYRGETQMGSTVATEFTSEGEGQYRVIAVDQSGNAGK
ncbi:MAG TPA: carbohydrate binding domain-containing protein [Planctomycetota bacterium]